MKRPTSKLKRTVGTRDLPDHHVNCPHRSGGLCLCTVGAIEDIEAAMERNR